MTSARSLSPDTRAAAGSEPRPSPDPVLRQTNVGRLLIRTFDRFEERVVRGLQARGYADFRPSDGGVLRNLDLDGTRVSEIARRAHMTPQGIGQIVQDLERRGYVRSRPDPTDGRAKLVLFTAAGRRLIATGQEVNRQLDEEWSGLLGSERFSALRQVLSELIAGTDEHGCPLLSPEGRIPTHAELQTSPCAESAPRP